jgi:hypothetical protein
VSEKALKAALGTLLGLVIVYLVVLAFGRGGAGGAGDASQLARALTGLSEASVQSVWIEGPTDTVALERAAGAWRVNGHPSDSAAVARFWDAVSDAEVRDLVASNPSNHGRLGVSADSTWRLAFRSDEDPTVEVLLGKPGPSFSSSFARLPDEDAVYLLEGGLRGAATRRLEDWRDRTIVVVDTAAVESVIFERGGDEHILARVDAGWTVDGAPARAERVGDLLRELASLEATGFAPDTITFEGEDRRRVVALGAGTDTLAVVDVAGSGDGTFLARTPGGSTVFRLSSFRVDRVVPAADSIRAEGDDEAGS